MQSIFDRLKARSGWQVNSCCNNVCVWGGAEHLQKFWAKWDTKTYKKVTSKNAFRGRQTDRQSSGTAFSCTEGWSHSFFLCSLSTHFENPTEKHKSIQQCIVKEAHSKLNTSLWLCNEGDREKKPDYNYKVIFNVATLLITGLRRV